MPKPTKGPRLGSSPAHERLMLSNLACALFENGKITTTETRAKRLQPLAERLISKARRGDLHARRQVLARLGNKAVVAKLFEEIAEQIDKEREGGYTRIVKLGNCRGDNAPIAEISLVLEAVEKKKKAKPAAKKEAAKAEAPKDEAKEESAEPVEEKAEEAKAEETEAAEAPAEETKDDAAPESEASAEESPSKAEAETTDAPAEEKAE